MPVLGCIPNRNDQIACVDFDILISDDTGQVEVAGWRSDVQIRVLGHFDTEADVVIGTTADAQSSRLSSRLEFDGYFFGPFGVLHVAGNAQGRGIAAADFDVARTEAHAQVAARLESRFEGAFTGSRSRPANGERRKDDTEAESGNQISHG